MLHYTYRLSAPAPHTPAHAMRQILDGCAVLAAPSTWEAHSPWPATDPSIMVAQAPQDTVRTLDPTAHAWIDQAAPGPKLEILWHSMRILWKSGRAYIQGPQALVDEALAAVLDYALLEQAITDLDNEARQLGTALTAWQVHAETGGSIAPLRQQLAQATALSLRLVELRPYCELPARTGTASPALRLRTELLTQSQYSDQLGLIEHRLELVVQGLENQLQRAQETRRGLWELAIGIGITVLLVIELAVTLHAEWLQP